MRAANKKPKKGTDVEPKNDPREDDKTRDIELDDLTPEKDAKGGGKGDRGPISQDPPPLAED